MKAEERKQLERNELANRLNTAWQGMSSHSTAVTVVWGVVLAALVGLIGYRYYSRNAAESRSAFWYQLENASDVKRLQEIIDEGKAGEAARIARFHLSRHQLQDALSRLASPTNSEARVKAADALVEARDRYAELAKGKTDEPTLIQEALMGVAKAEEILASVPATDSAGAMRGSLDRAIEAYQALASKYPESHFGKLAAKRAEEIKNHRARIEAFYVTLSQAHAKDQPAPNPVPVPPDKVPDPLNAVPPGGAPELPKALEADPKAPPTVPKADPPADAPKPGDAPPK